MLVSVDLGSPVLWRFAEPALQYGTRAHSDRCVPQLRCVWCSDPRCYVTAVSTGGSNGAGQEVGEDFCWGSVAEDTAWSVVEFGGHAVEVGLVVGDLGSFGEVFAEWPVGVFVGAAFPG